MDPDGIFTAMKILMSPARYGRRKQTDRLNRGLPVPTGAATRAVLFPSLTR